MTTEDEIDTSNILPHRDVIYCGACGMPPEYCEYGPDFETHCDPWLRKHHPELRHELKEKRGVTTTDNAGDSKEDKPPKPTEPWTTEQRLTAFYEKYVPEKIDGIPGLLEKYAGKEEKLFEALVKKYGPEPLDPYYSDSEDDEDSVDHHDHDAPADAVGGRSKRRGASAKKKTGDGTLPKVIVQKQAQKKKRVLTVVTGLEAALSIKNEHKLKDATKAFSKRFAGSSSAKDGHIIVQGEHVIELAEMIIDKFQIPAESVFIDMGDGHVVPLHG